MQGAPKRAVPAALVDAVLVPSHPFFLRLHLRQRLLTCPPETPGSGTVDGSRLFADGGAEVCWTGVGAREGRDREGSPGGVAGGDRRVSTYPGQVRRSVGAVVGFDPRGLFFYR